MKHEHMSEQEVTVWVRRDGDDLRVECNVCPDGSTYEVTDYQAFDDPEAGQPITLTPAEEKDVMERAITKAVDHDLDRWRDHLRSDGPDYSSVGTGRVGMGVWWKAGAR